MSSNSTSGVSSTRTSSGSGSSSRSGGGSSSNGPASSSPPPAPVTSTVLVTSVVTVSSPPPSTNLSSSTPITRSSPLSSGTNSTARGSVSSGDRILPTEAMTSSSTRPDVTAPADGGVQGTSAASSSSTPIGPIVGGVVGGVVILGVFLFIAFISTKRARQRRQEREVAASGFDPGMMTTPSSLGHNTGAGTAPTIGATSEGYHYRRSRLDVDNRAAIVSPEMIAMKEHQRNSSTDYHYLKPERPANDGGSWISAGSIGSVPASQNQVFKVL